MAYSTGQIAQQHANAQRFLSWNRGLALQLGIGSHVSVHTGRPHVLAHLFDMRSLHLMEMHALHRFAPALNSDENCGSDDGGDYDPERGRECSGADKDAEKWSHVNSIAFVGMEYDDEDLEALQEMLEMLHAQIPVFQDVHQQWMYENVRSFSVPQQYANLFENFYNDVVEVETPFAFYRHTPMS